MLDGVCSADEGQHDEAEDEQVGVGGLRGERRPPSQLPRKDVLLLPQLVRPGARGVDIFLRSPSAGAIFSLSAKRSPMLLSSRCRTSLLAWCSSRGNSDSISGV